jgi:hypothetical protein
VLVPGLVLVPTRARPRRIAWAKARWIPVTLILMTQAFLPARLFRAGIASDDEALTLQAWRSACRQDGAPGGPGPA